MYCNVLGSNMTMIQGYQEPTGNTPTDTIVGVIPTDTFDEDYQRLKAAGVEFLGEPQHIWNMHCTYFRVPEGNLFELMDSSI